MNTDNLILRETDNLPLINKDDTLTNAEIDGNFICSYNKHPLTFDAWPPPRGFAAISRDFRIYGSKCALSDDQIRKKIKIGGKIMR